MGAMMKITNGVLFLFLFLLITAYGCSSARQVEILPGNGGTVAISPRDSQEARDKAHILMSQTCQGRGFEIIKEGEVVVGQSTQTHHNQQANLGKNKYDPDYSSYSSSSTDTSNKIEWRIEFRCH